MLSHYQSTAVDDAGNVLASATITVRSESSGALAALKLDRAGSTGKNNPFTISSPDEGQFDFYVEGGAYKIVVTSGSLTRTLRYVALGTAAELDQDDLAGLHGMRYSRATGTDPSLLTDGELCGDHANLALATTLYISKIDIGGNDQSNRLLAMDDSTSTVKGQLVIRLSAGDEQTFSVTAVSDLEGSSPADAVVALTVTLVSGDDNTSSGDTVFLEYSRTGDKGDTGPAGDTGATGATGATGPVGPSVARRFTFSTTTTDSDPGSGVLRFNNGTPSSVTAIYIDNNESGGSSVTGWLDTFDDSGDSSLRGYLSITDLDDPLLFQEFQVSGSVVDGTGYRKLTVARVSGSSLFANAARLGVSFYPRGPAGSGVGDVTAAATITDNRIVRGDGGAKGVQESLVGIDDSGNITGAVTIDIGNADTTLSRSAAGVLAVEGVNLLSTATGLAQGKHTICVPAASMISRTTNGAAPGVAEMSTNKNMVRSLDFDAATQEFAQFSIAMPKSWNEGTVTFQPVWSHASTTTNFGVVWALQGVAVSDDDTLDAAFGTEQTSTDTGGTTNDLYIGPESAAITIGGSPAENDVVQFQIKRNVSDGSDTMAIDARLHGIRLFITYNAGTDA